MALINCPECSGKVSDQAESCPHCGYSLVNVKKLDMNISAVVAHTEPVKEVKYNVINVDGKNFAVKADGPYSEYYCPDCHSRVSSFSTMCGNCNKNLVVSNVVRSSSYSTPIVERTESYNKQSYIPETSQKSKTAALLLMLFFEWISFGFVGLHDFYVGKIMQGLVKFILRIAAFSVDEFSVKCLLLFIVGIWQLIDFIMIIMGVYKDKHGLPLKNSNW